MCPMSDEDIGGFPARCPNLSWATHRRSLLPKAGFQNARFMDRRQGNEYPALHGRHGVGREHRGAPVQRSAQSACSSMSLSR